MNNIMLIVRLLLGGMAYFIAGFLCMVITHYFENKMMRKNYWYDPVTKSWHKKKIN